MCVVQGRYRITNTEILVAPTLDNRQLTVYSNRVVALFKNKKKNKKNKKGQEDPTKAMILPVVSYEEGKDVKLVDLSPWSEMFQKVDVQFRFKKSACTGFIGCGVVAGVAIPQPIQVHRVGSYEVSIVPSKDDFDRLDKDVFILDPNVGKLFAGLYTRRLSSSFILSEFILREILDKLCVRGVQAGLQRHLSPHRLRLT